MGVSSLLAAIKRHKWKFSFLSLFAFVIWYLRKKYLTYVKPFLELLRNPQDESDPFSMIQNLYGLVENEDEAKFAKYQRISDATAMSNLQQLKTEIANVCDVDSLVLKLREKPDGIDQGGFESNMHQIVRQVWARVLLGAVHVNCAFLVNRAQINLLGRRIRRNEEVNDKDRLAFLLKAQTLCKALRPFRFLRAKSWSRSATAS